MTDLEACHFATELLRAAGFEFAYASMKSEACYYRWPGETDLIRVAAHKHDRGVAGLGKVIAKVTFARNNRKHATFSETHILNAIATCIGWYQLRNREVVAYTGRQPRYTPKAA